MYFKTEVAWPIEAVTRCTDGVEPRYGKGTGQGEVSCPECYRNVAHILYDSATKRFVGRFQTVCECGTQISYANAEKFI